MTPEAATLRDSGAVADNRERSVAAAPCGARARDAGGGSARRACALHGRSRKPQYGGARRLRADPCQLSRPEGAVSRALAPFCDRRARSVGRARGANGRGSRPPRRRAPSSISRSPRCCSMRARVRRWKYLDPGTEQVVTRSEGLAVASLRMFEAGAFSSDPADPLRADAERLTHLKHEEIADGMQSMVGNRLVGVEGRADLLASARQGGRCESKSIRARGSRAAGRALRLSRRARRGRQACPRRASSKRCSNISDRSGRAGSRSAASRSAIPGGIPRSGATMPPTASCRSTSSRSGSPTR